MIPFNKPWLSGKEIEYLQECLESAQICGDRGFTRKCQTFMEERFGAARVLLTTSCTSALEMAALLLDFEPDDEVILPSFTFVSTVNAFHLRGARPRFVDIDPVTLNLDPKAVAAAITNRTKAIVPVHYAGVGCDMAALGSLVDGRSIVLVEDAAQGVDATYDDRFLGTIGDLGTFSFHETKNFVSGEGGALVINRPDLIERAEVLREKGTNRSQFLRGQVDKYTWVDVGSSYIPSDLLAAVLLAQLEAMDSITAKRAAAYEAYQAGLEKLERQGILRRPVIPGNCRINYHMYYILLADLETRSRLIEFLKQRDIAAVFHYVPLHSSPMGRSLGYEEGMLPVTEDISNRLLRLPLYAGLSGEQVQQVVDSIYSFFDVEPPRDQA